MIHDAVVHKITRRNPSLQDWPYYGIIDILNPVATAQYQHGVTIPTKPGMVHDFRDLRFFQADGTELPFWNESKTDGSTSFNWIKPYSASQRKVYVFYGNRDAVSQSNGDKVFELFDDFLGSSLDATKWTVSGSPTIAGSVVTLPSSGSAATIISNSAFGQNYAMRSRCKSAHFGSNTYIEGIEFQQPGYLASFLCYTSAGYAGKHATYTDAFELSAISGVTADTYFILDQIRNGSTSVVFKIDNANTVTHSTKVTSITAGIRFVVQVSGASVSADWVLVRKYTATEPTCQLNQSGLRNPIYR